MKTKKSIKETMAKNEVFFIGILKVLPLKYKFFRYNFKRQRKCVARIPKENISIKFDSL